MPYKDPEKRSAYMASYRATHKEEMAAKTAAYCATHREEVRSAKMVYYTAHKKEIVCKGCGKSAKVYRGGKFCSLDCYHGWHAGQNNPRWQGGRSFEPYCPLWTKDLRNRIRSFFDHRCVICGKSEEENGKKLSCHHVEYNKLACCDGKLVHFAALCISCHTKTNHGSPIWEAMIHRIIDEIYDGRSYYTKEEYLKMRGG